MNNSANRCMECGKDISFKRNDAKYCNSKCRMRFHRGLKKIDLLWELYNICSLNPKDAFTNQVGKHFIKLPKAYKGKQEIVNIEELKDLSNDKIRYLIDEKKKEMSNQKIVDGILGLINNK